MNSKMHSIRFLILTSLLALIISVQFIYTVITVEWALSMAPMLPFLAAEFKLNDQQVSLLSGVCALGLGYSNFVIVPCSNIFGRRFTSILLGALLTRSSIWGASAKSYTSLLAARVINGAATATNESLMVQVVADVHFLHKRGLWMGVFVRLLTIRLPTHHLP
jgi:predicted MFS family arabinose efflux permease